MKTITKPDEHRLYCGHTEIGQPCKIPHARAIGLFCYACNSWVAVMPRIDVTTITPQADAVRPLPPELPDETVSLPVAQAAEIAKLRAACSQALSMAENLHKATGDAIPGGIVWTLRTALDGVKV